MPLNHNPRNGTDASGQQHLNNFQSSQIGQFKRNAPVTNGRQSLGAVYGNRERHNGSHSVTPYKNKSVPLNLSINT